MKRIYVGPGPRHYPFLPVGKDKVVSVEVEPGDVIEFKNNTPAPDGYWEDTTEADTKAEIAEGTD